MYLCLNSVSVSPDFVQSTSGAHWLSVFGQKGEQTTLHLINYMMKIVFSNAIKHIETTGKKHVCIKYYITPGFLKLGFAGVL